ncbi:MAG: winged helix-turn-helix domain-containing protein [Anaerolineales bacterium]
MTSKPQPITISKKTAQRFLLDHHFLLPPRQMEINEILPKIFDRLGCIQFDTINVVGRNADLVLQSRVKGYTSAILEKLLYEDRTLIDGWDKMASIYPTSDWPYFNRRRQAMRHHTRNRSEDAAKAAPEILEAVKQNGPLSSIDIKDDRKTDWWWAPTSISRAAMEALFHTGDLGIDHRVNTRRVFDLIERLVPADILTAPDPHQSDEDYRAWHYHRRLGSMGIGSIKSGEYWYGIHDGYKVPERKKGLNTLISDGRITSITIEGITGQNFYIRTEDYQRIENIPDGDLKTYRAAFIAPLDNLIWNRSLINDLFNFSYTWEVYKPQKDRQYGYYVLPVLYQDRFIARVDMKLDSKTNILHLIDWWWEEGIERTPEMESAISEAFADFLRYLQGDKINLVRENFTAKRQASLFEALIGEANG